MRWSRWKRVARLALAVGCAAFAALAPAGWAQSTKYNTGPSGSAGAEPRSSTYSPEASSGAKGQGALTGKEVEGTVKSVDRSANQLTLSDGQQLEVNSSTKISKDGKRATLDDVKQGDDIRASFAPGNDTKVQEITIASPRKSAGKSSDRASGNPSR